VELRACGNVRFVQRVANREWGGDGVYRACSNACGRSGDDYGDVGDGHNQDGKCRGDGEHAGDGCAAEGAVCVSDYGADFDAGSDDVYGKCDLGWEWWSDGRYGRYRLAELLRFGRFGLADDE
jgi:hypothetical protein